MLAEIHVAPTPPGTADNPHAHVEAAIAVVQSSGLTYEVGALGTTVEGDADAVWSVLREAHEAVLAAGAVSVITSIRLGDRAGEGYSIDRLTAKFRNRP